MHADMLVVMHADMRMCREAIQHKICTAEKYKVLYQRAAQAVRPTQHALPAVRPSKQARACVGEQGSKWV
jgi:hypothetical protein